MRTQLVSGVIALALCTLNQVSAAEDNVEAFKSFVASPPVVKEIIFEYQEYHEKAQTNAAKVFLARRDTNAIFLREAANVAELKSKAVFERRQLAGRFGNEYWYFGLDPASLFKWTNVAGETLDKRNSAY